MDLKVKEQVIQDTFSILTNPKERKYRLTKLDKKRGTIRKYANWEKKIEEIFTVDEYLSEID